MLALTITAGLLLAPLLLPIILSEVVYREQVLPGVRVQGLALGQRSAGAAASELGDFYGEFLDRPLTLTYGQQRWSPRLEELGVEFNPDLLAGEAYFVGRRGDPLTRLVDVWQLWTSGVELGPAMVVDQGALQGYLARVADQIEQPPENASLSIAAARVIGTPSTPGTQILADATAGEMLLALQRLQPAEIPLRTRELAPRIGDQALVTAQNEAQELLQSAIVLQHEDREWVWGPDRLAELITITPMGDRLEVAIDELQLGRAVERLAQLVDTGTAEPRLRFINGEVRIVEEGQPGWRLEHLETLAAISETLQLVSPITRTVILPVEQTFPQVTEESLADLGIRELVGEGQSSFVGSAEYRIINIRAGAVRMDGVLIAPGDEFSFNTQLGEVNAENGFVEGYAIIGNRTQLEWGGGVCQDSTTVFRAAFWAGLPITERHAHSFYISWYDRFGLGPYGDGQGLDAAIYTGVNDLKFVNDTGAWLLMQTEMDEVNQILSVRLYGTKPDREVRLEGPVISNSVAAPTAPVYVDDPSYPRGTVFQSDVARSGRDITIQRVIIEQGVEVRRDTFFTRFRSWPNTFVRGTG